MTISNLSVKTTVVGNSAQSVFTYAFPVTWKSECDLYLTNSADGSITLLDPSTWALTGENNPNGGTFVYPISGTPIPSTQSLTLVRRVSAAQTTSLGNQGPYFPRAVEGGLGQCA